MIGYRDDWFGIVCAVGAVDPFGRWRLMRDGWESSHVVVVVAGGLAYGLLVDDPWELVWWLRLSNWRWTKSLTSGKMGYNPQGLYP